jgi:hypothetical protein
MPLRLIRAIIASLRRVCKHCPTLAWASVDWLTSIANQQFPCHWPAVADNGGIVEFAITFVVVVRRANLEVMPK